MKEKFAAHEATPFQTPCFEYHLDYVREVLLIMIVEWTCFEVSERTIIIQSLARVMRARETRANQTFPFGHDTVWNSPESTNMEMNAHPTSLSSHYISTRVVSIKIKSMHLNLLVSFLIVRSLSFRRIIKSLDYWTSSSNYRGEHVPSHGSHFVPCSEMQLLCLDGSCSKDNDGAHWQEANMVICSIILDGLSAWKQS